MKKILWIGLSAVILWAKPSCYEAAQKLHDLQNAIVEKSFLTLSEGAWAVYHPKIKVVSIGRRTEKNRTLYGIEIHANGKSAQIWYRLIEKPFEFAGHTIRFKTLDPYEVYLSMGPGRVMRIDKAELDLFMQMQGKRWSTILTFGRIIVPPQCEHVPELRTLSYSFDDGKSVEAVRITDPQTGAYIVVSDEVPFGLIESNDGVRTTLRMTEYGIAGGRTSMTDSVRSKAIPLSVSSFLQGR
jgi:hypothetical protein